MLSCAVKMPRKNEIRAENSLSFVTRGMTLVPTRGLHVPPRGVVGPSTRKLCRYPGARYPRYCDATEKQREKTILGGWKRERPRSSFTGGGERRAERGCWSAARAAAGMMQTGMYAGRFVRMHIRALISFLRPATLLSPPERRRNPRARARARARALAPHHKGRINHFSRSTGRTRTMRRSFARDLPMHPVLRLFLLTFDPLRYASAIGTRSPISWCE